MNAEGGDESKMAGNTTGDIWDNCVDYDGAPGPSFQFIFDRR